MGQSQEGSQRVYLKLALPDGGCGELSFTTQVYRDPQDQCFGAVFEVAWTRCCCRLELLKGVSVCVDEDEL